jgi:hypothetical protein
MMMMILIFVAVSTVLRHSHRWFFVAAELARYLIWQLKPLLFEKTGLVVELSSRHSTSVVGAEIVSKSLQSIESARELQISTRGD